MVHSLKPSPVSNRQDPNRFFDFFSHTPESVHMLTQVYTDLGTPASYREMDGNSVHAYRFVNANGEVSFVKFHWKSRQGVKTLTAAEANAKSFNYATDDLYQAIGVGHHPQWDLYVKVLRPADIANLDYDPFDATKDWYDVPERKVGTMTLDRMPENFFQDTEQSAFAPSNMIPGIEPSPDRLLQGRLFSYADTHRHRLGANHMALPINAPRNAVANNNQDGPASIRPRSGEVNFYPSQAAPQEIDPSAQAPAYPLAGEAAARPIAKTNDFAQAGIFYRSLNAGQRANLISNLAGDLGQVTNTRVKTTMISYFYQADRDYGERLAEALKVPMRDVQAAIQQPIVASR
jgi:catalase